MPSDQYVPLQVVNRPPRRILRQALALALLISASTSAHLPEFFGRKFVLEDTQSVPKNQPVCAGDRPQLIGQAEIMEERLLSLQREQGAYAPSLADPVGEIALLHAERCHHSAALAAYRRAIHLVRIHEGLLTNSQLPYVRKLSESSLAIGDYRSAQLALRYALRVHGMGLEELSSEGVADALAYFQRARDLFIDPRTRSEPDLFLEAYHDNLAVYQAQLARTLEGQGVSYAELKAIALSHLSNLYLIQGSDLSSGQFSADTRGAEVLEFFQNAQGLIYGKGLDVLEALLERPEASVGIERADLLVRLGNWQQWHERSVSACDRYAQAWAEAEGEAGVSLRQRLSLPAELPEDPALWKHLLGADIPILAVVEVDFRVSSTGTITSVRGKTVDADGNATGGPVIRWLRDSHARPAVDDGVCVEGNLHAQRYRLLK